MTSVNGLKNTQALIKSQKIKDTHDEQMLAHGFERNMSKTIITFVACILTAGLLRLFFHWYPHLYLYATHKKCDLKRATKVLIVDDYQSKYKSYFVKEIKIVSMRDLSSELMIQYFKKKDKNLINKFKSKNLELNLENGTKCQVQEYKAFWCKKECYVLDEKINEFSRLTNFEKYALCSDLRTESINGLSTEEQLLRRITYGYNKILVPLQGIQKLFILEILNPFYVFQVFSLIVWFNEGYFYYAIAVIFMSAFGIVTSIRQTRKNQINLRNTVASTETVRVLKNTGEYENVSSDELVPGDIIALSKHRAIVSCDAILLTGSCIVNESMLTGESVPVMKTPLLPHPTLYNSKEHSHHTLFCGTTIIQTKQHENKPIFAKVIRTGLWTNKGSLISAILYPPPIDFKFDQDSYILIAILIGIAFCGFFYTLTIMIERGNTATNIAIKTLTIFTIVIPPALPSVMAVGKIYALFRLKSKQIYCINAKAINISGSIDCVCFDKTGTLTEDGLDMMGVVAHENNKLNELEKNIKKLHNTRIFRGMLVCHSLTLIDGKLNGDPLDVKMFESTGWGLFEPEIINSENCHSRQGLMIVRSLTGNTFDEKMEILQQYQFSSTLQRMSVIARLSYTEKLIAFTKGSPEMIISLSVPSSIPVDIMIILKNFTEQGYRVIAVACKDVNVIDEQIQKIPREEVERDLEFLGLIILENRLKKSSAQIIRNLRDANIKTVMITGDNIQTAISVAKECGILSHDESVINVSIVQAEDKSQTDIYFHVQGNLLSEKKIKTITSDELEFENYIDNYKFALTGDTWRLLRVYHVDIIPKICTRGVVFARMSSDQKQELVLELIQLGYYVAMCGDGANDCGALRAAHVGISLSEAESSVASPFTSRIPNITCVPIVIQQGRAALVTSFGIFKFTVCYSLTEFISTVILYSIGSNFTGMQFFYVDVLLFVNFAFFFGKTEAYSKRLAKEPPTSSLISFTPLLSVTVHAIIIALFELIVFHTVQHLSWFTPFVMKDEFIYDSYENYSIFCLSTFQYSMIAIIFSRGKPYRKAIYTNKCFILSIIILSIINLYITLYPALWVVNLLELKMPPVYDWRFMIIVLAMINFLICFGFESFIIQYVIQKKLKPRLYKPENSKKKYLLIEYELKWKPNWPPISTKFVNLLTTSNNQNIFNSTQKASIAEPSILISIVTENEQNIRMNQISIKNGFDNIAFEKNLSDNGIDKM